MFAAIGHNLRNLADFTGRDARPTFWFYVLAIVILRFVAGMAVSIPMMASMFSGAFSNAQNGAKPQAMQAEMMGSVVAYMPLMMWAGLAIGIVSVLLLLASFVRRLHDSGVAGWWALVPLAIYAAVLAQMPAQMQRAMAIMNGLAATPGAPPDATAIMRDQGAMPFLVYIPLLMVIYGGVRGSTVGTNKFGDEPGQF